MEKNITLLFHLYSKNIISKKKLQAKSDELSAKSPFEILNYLNDVPDEYKTSIKNNAGGFALIIIFFITFILS